MPLIILPFLFHREVLLTDFTPPSQRRFRRLTESIKHAKPFVKSPEVTHLFHNQVVFHLFDARDAAGNFSCFVDALCRIDKTA